MNNPFPFYFETIWPQNWIKQAALHCSKQKLMVQEIVELRFCGALIELIEMRFFTVQVG